MKHEYDKRAKFTDATGVTLDGEPAKISGRYNDQATVWKLANPNFMVNFSWPTVERIFETKNKQFKS